MRITPLSPIWNDKKLESGSDSNLKLRTANESALLTAQTAPTDNFFYNYPCLLSMLHQSELTTFSRLLLHEIRSHNPNIILTPNKFTHYISRVSRSDDNRAQRVKLPKRASAPSPRSNSSLITDGLCAALAALRANIHSRKEYFTPPPGKFRNWNRG